MQAGLLSTEQKQLIEGKQFAENSYFNTIQDANNNWIISVEEIESCVNENLLWVKDLPLINYEPKQIEALINFEELNINT
jgi:hypothetical protein